MAGGQVSPTDLAVLLDRDIDSVRAILCLRSAGAVLSALSGRDMPETEVDRAAVLGLAARIFLEPQDLFDWDQAIAIGVRHLGLSPVLQSWFRAS